MAFWAKDAIVKKTMHDFVEYFLQSVSDINATNVYGSTLLHNAVLTGDNALVSLVLRYNPCVDKLDGRGKTPLAIAIKEGFLSIADLLLEHEPEIIHDPRLVVLRDAVYSGNPNAVALLLKHGACPDLVDDRGLPLLILAIERGYSAIVDLLLKAGAIVTFGGILATAVNCGDRAIVERLLKAGADANDCDSSGKTALMIACEHKRIDLAQLLLEHGAKVDIEWQGRKLIFYAFEQGSVELVDLFVRFGARINERDREGVTPLHIACRIGSDVMVKRLLLYGVPIDEQSPLINVETSHGETPLMIALLKGDTKIVMLLLKAGARPDLLLNGSNILEFCAQRSYNDVVQMLLQNHIVRNQINPNYPRLLEIAIRNNDRMLIELLLSFHRITKEEGAELLCIAVRNGNIEIVKDLLARGAKGDPEKLRQVCGHVEADIMRELLLSGLKLEEIAPQVVRQSVENYIRTVITPTRAFIEAIKNDDQVRCLDILRHNSIEVNLPDEHGNTALHHCVLHNNVTMIKELLVRGADITLKNNDGNNPLYYANPDVVNVFITAAMPMREVCMRAIFQNSKKLAAYINVSASRYQEASEKLHEIKKTIRLLSRLGCAVSAGLFCAAAYKGCRVFKPHEFRLLLRQVWKPFVAGVSILANSILLLKAYKYPIFNYCMQGYLERLRASNDASSTQAIALQDNLKNDYHKRRAASFFDAGLYVPQNKLRQDIINEFRRKGPEDATYVMTRLYGRLYSECCGY
jgi:ankyrin repeat protein